MHPCFRSHFYTQEWQTHPGVYKFWNGAHQRAEKGVEAGVLALIDVGDHMAYHIEATQTQAVTVDAGALLLR